MHNCSPLLVVTSSSGKKRLVINLRYVNRHLWKDKFKYEDMRTGLMFLRKVITSALLTSSHHVDIHKASQTYLGFQWEGKYFVFTVLPFGLSTACYVFTKLLRLMVKLWRSNGIKAIM